jgi:hypothetical protein
MHYQIFESNPSRIKYLHGVDFVSMANKQLSHTTPLPPGAVDGPGTDEQKPRTAAGLHAVRG